MTLYDKFDIIIKKAFWDLLSDDLNQIPPKYNHLIILLKEIRDRLCNITPNNQKITQKLNAGLDIQYLEQLFKHQVFNTEVLLDIITFIFNHLLTICSPIDDNSIIETQNAFIKEAQNAFIKEDKGNFNYSELVPKILSFIFASIEKIESDLLTFKKLYNLPL